MSDPNKPAKPELVERRRRPRGTNEAQDWETLALRRIARRVKSLPPDSTDTSHSGGTPGYGWEEAVLERLRKRIDGPDDY